MMSNGAPSADANIGDGGASRDGGRDRAMNRVGMSCDGATSVGKASNGRTMTGGMTSGAATTTLGAVVASSDGTMSHKGPLSDGATSHCAASNGRTMTGSNTSGAGATTLGAQRWHDEPQWPNERWRDEQRPHHDGRRGYDDRGRGERERDWHDRRDDRRDDRRGEGQPQHSGRRVGPPMHGVQGRDEQQIRDAQMRNERPASSRSTAGQLNAKRLSSHISNAGNADALLALSAAHSTSLDFHTVNILSLRARGELWRRSKFAQIR